MAVRLEVTIAWGDCDEAGIVFYPNYLYWMDSAFNAWLRERGLSQRVLRQRFGALGTPILECGAKFLSPASYDDVLAIEATVAEWRDRSFRVEYRGGAAGRPVFEGFEARVWAVPGGERGMRAAPIPASFREALA